MLLSEGEVVDGVGKVFLLHAQETHAGLNAAVAGFRLQQIAEALVGFVDLARVERGESGALGRIARDAGVHLGQFFLVLAYLRGNLRVIRVRLEILAKLRCTCGVSRVPDQRLAQRRLRVGIGRMSLKDADAFSARCAVVSEKRAKSNGVAWLGGTTRNQFAEAGNGSGFAFGSTVESLVVAERDVTVGRIVAVELAIDAHRLVVAALACQLAGLAKLVSFGGSAGQRIDARDIGIPGINFAQAIERLIRKIDGANQFVIFGKACESVSVVRCGEEDLLPSWMAMSGRPRASRARAFSARLARAASAEDWRRSFFERVLPGERATGNSLRADTPCQLFSIPSSALPFYFQFGFTMSSRAYPKLNLPVEKTVRNSARR